MRRLLVALALASILAAVGATFAFARATSVSLRDNFFSRGTVRIRHGSAVHWTWSKTRNVHNVTGTTTGARVHSKTGHSGSLTFTFTRRGTYTFICTRHPTQMRMTVKVT